jgi:hypothetical protein
MAINIATENPRQIVTREAGANVTKRRFVVEIAGGKVDRCSVEGEVANGVAAATATAGDEVGVKRGGTVIMEAGAAIADNAEVMTDNVGRPITAVGAGKYKLGKITNGNYPGAAGDLCSVELYEVPVLAIV